ncbi:MAG TPA: M3 family oligoendopeptidase [Gemmatimonadaceae bacterium]|nr:M3 family oligoendopeptidase [Gemmatimonadaceae bacterium]
MLLAPLVDLPSSPDDLKDATWPDIEVLYKSVLDVSVAPDDAERWLTTWSRLEELVEEAGTRAMIAYTCDTADAVKEQANLRWSADIFPRAAELQVALAKKLLALGYSRADLETVLRGMRTDIEIFREENVPLYTQLEELVSEYQKITGGLEVEWDGETKTVPQLQPFLKSHDRAVRERAFRKQANAYLEQRATLSSLFDRMYVLRDQIARNAGFTNFVDYSFASKHRFDYTPDDCRAFHNAVQETVAPAVERLMKYRRERLGITSVRPWDTPVLLETKEPPVPFTDIGGLVEPAKRIFHTLNPELGRQFDRMAEEKMLDLGSRSGKAPGGYCVKLSYRGMPFIFMNAVGVPDDVNTLLHEAGHSFHDFAAHPQPFIWQRSSGHEAAELASMSMELFGLKHLAKPTGYYSPTERDAAEIEQFEDILQSLAHIASVDAFQLWLYTSGKGGDAEARDREWVAIRDRFERGIDWSGLQEERVSRWYRQLHIFEYPLYYIEYGIAQMGALQLWRDSLREPKQTLERYREALALGGTRPLPEIYKAAGARLVFDAAGMRDLIQRVEERIAQLRS